MRKLERAIRVSHLWHLEDTISHILEAVNIELKRIFIIGFIAGIIVSIMIISLVMYGYD